MSIIEQATRRLEELKRAGIEIPGTSSPEPVHLPNGSVRPAGGTAAAPAAEPLGVKRPATNWSPRPVPKSIAPNEPVSRTVEIDLDALAAQGYLTPAGLNRSLADEFRVLKMQLIKSMDSSHERGEARSNLVLVSSSVPAEGKTFVSVNLAMSLAMEFDRSVLLVDADVLRPAVMARLGLTADVGLLDLVTRPELDFSEAMLRTNVPKLSLLPAGTQTNKSTELLASAGMERLLTELSERYPDRIVVFDAPPMLVATEARQLASRVGQVLMVVEANKTSSQLVARAFAAVESCPNVFSVLNRCPMVSSGAGYGYYAEG